MRRNAGAFKRHKNFYFLSLQHLYQLFCQPLVATLPTIYECLNVPRWGGGKKRENTKNCQPNVNLNWKKVYHMGWLP
jgi:hypothetical protein